jgi:hypothetical protein
MIFHFLTREHEYFIYIQYGLSCGTEGEIGYSSGTGEKESDRWRRE